MPRHNRADVVWTLPATGNVDQQIAILAVLMDIRDELQALHRLADCHRIPRALDAMHELGVEAERRRKRNAAKKRKATKAAA